jgi:iron complex outermembrane receptor protein
VPFTSILGLKSISLSNAATTTGFVLLQYANQAAQLYGWDLSGNIVLFDGKRTGSIEANGIASYVRGKNLTTGDNLYNIMPLHGRLLISYRLGFWSVSPEVLAVAKEDEVSQVRKEMQTDAYWLFNLRSAIVWKHLRVDFAVENLLDRLYANPLGGAYLGQGSSMTTHGIPWGVVVPGRGRSFNASVSLSYWTGLAWKARRIPARPDLRRTRVGDSRLIQTPPVFGVRCGFCLSCSISSCY